MLRIAGRDLDPRLIVFDKDGTLIDYDSLWRTRFARLMQALDSLVSLEGEARLGLAATLGFDPETGEWDPRGPLTVASNAEVALLLASQVYRYQGKSWDEALSIIAKAEEKALAGLSLVDLVEPVGDVKGTLQRLSDEGLALAVATTDDRHATEQALRKLGVWALFAAVVCGDDGIPLKPVPDMALAICRQLGIAPRDAIMVGDTIGDLTMAKRAGFAYAVGVASGPLSGEALALHADMVIPDIHAIEIVPSGREGER